MTVKRLQIISWIVIIGCMLIGGLLAIYLIGKETGVYDYELLFPITIGTVGGFLIFLVISRLKKKRNGNVPDFDERSVSLIKKYLMISLYVILFGSGAALIIVYAMGIKYIETGLLMIYLFSLYIILGLGTLVVKRL
ncbi:hypothetical protein [Cytobacillus praedii]|uniref:DUF2178 domain-containing protein n=1 Tax=Cytobacillus praedii TaxID=1742358 RepID=A0A4R1AP92_9BACI|nr:hypothetical protein [Cytobacillus praedii]TCJ01205.1 hypothetical protein E0Y62_25155 [Cytobacillus praedii]